MRRPSAALILIISLFMAGPTIAGPFEDALEACDRGDHMTEYRLIKPLADQGDAAAQFHLGVMYDDGHGLPQDYVLAYMWFTLAASHYPASEIADRNNVTIKLGD